MDEIDFAAGMRARMAAQKIRVSDLSKQTGISQPRISEYASGRRLPPNERLESIAAALDWPFVDALHAAGRHKSYAGDIASDAPVEARDVAKTVAAQMGALDREDRWILRALLLDLTESFVRTRGRKADYNSVL